MSLIQEIEKIIFLNYREGDIFTTTDIQKLAVQNGIIKENNDTAVANTLFSLKNDIRIRRIGRGRYQITYKNLDFSENESIEKLFEKLISRLKRYKEMNPINVDKDTMVKASIEVDKYRKYLKILQNLMDSN